MNTRGRGLSHQEIRSLVGHDSPEFLEIGCNEGDDTIHFLEVFKGGNFYCFECDPRPIANFKKNIRDPRAHLYEVALDFSSGRKTFHQSSGQPKGWAAENDKSGSLCQPTGHMEQDPGTTFLATIEVPTITLDEWARLNRPRFSRDLGVNVAGVDFMWIDVQGAELRVFRGGQAVLSRTKWVHAEVHVKQLYAGQPTTAEEVLKVLPDFRVVGRYGGDILFRNTRYP